MNLRCFMVVPRRQNQCSVRLQGHDLPDANTRRHWVPHRVLRRHVVWQGRLGGRDFLRWHGCVVCQPRFHRSVGHHGVETRRQCAQPAAKRLFPHSSIGSTTVRTHRVSQRPSVQQGQTSQRHPGECSPQIAVRCCRGRQPGLPVERRTDRSRRL